MSCRGVTLPALALLVSVKQLLKRFVPHFVVTWARCYRLRRHIASYPRRVVEHTYAGHTLKVVLRDRVAAEWYDRDWLRMPEVEFLKKSRLGKGATVFDAGAHQCVVALVLAKEVGERGLVVAIEGQTHNATVGIENADINRVEQLKVVHGLVAEESGVDLPFTNTLNGAISEFDAAVTVRSVSLDQLARQFGFPDVVFVDVEGYECQVLRGSREVLKHGPDFFIEVHREAGLESHGSVSEIIDTFRTNDFRLYWSHGEEQEFTALNSERERELPNHKFFLIARKE